MTVRGCSDAAELDSCDAAQAVQHQALWLVDFPGAIAVACLWLQQACLLSAAAAAEVSTAAQGDRTLPEVRATRSTCMHSWGIWCPKAA